MNKLERVLEAIAGRGAGYVPVGVWYHFPQQFHQGTESVAAHAKYFRDTGVDFVKVMNENVHPGDAGISTAADWQHYRPLDVRSPQLRDQLDIVKRLADLFGDEAMVISTIHGAVASMAHATGRAYEARPTALREHARQEPEYVARGLAATGEALAEFAQLSVEAGASGIYYAAFGAEQDNFTSEEFASWIAPADRQVLSAAGEAGATTFVHVCKTGVDLDRFVDYPTDVMNWTARGGDLSLAEGAALFDGKAILGGLDTSSPTLVSGSADEIAAFVDDALAAGAGVERFLLGGDCSLDSATPTDHIRIITERAHR